MNETANPDGQATLEPVAEVNPELVDRNITNMVTAIKDEFAPGHQVALGVFRSLFGALEDVDNRMNQDGEVGFSEAEELAIRMPGSARRAVSGGSATTGSESGEIVARLDVETLKVMAGAAHKLLTDDAAGKINLDAADGTQTYTQPGKTRNTLGEAWRLINGEVEVYDWN